MPRDVYCAYTGRHPRFKVVARKEWGVAMLALPESMDAYLAGRARQHLRRKRRRARSLGFEFRPFDSLDWADDIMNIHTSAPVRQGIPMQPSYTDRANVDRFCERYRTLHGVFSSDGRLRAYTYAPVLGEVGSFHRLLGHADDLRHGIMYLLVSEVIGTYIASKVADGQPSWAMYDTFWGSQPGLAEFKRRLGFAPYRVDWQWSEHG